LDATDTATIQLQFHDDMKEEIDEKSAEQSNKAPMPVPPSSDTLNSGLRHDTATVVAERLAGMATPSVKQGGRQLDCRRGERRRQGRRVEDRL
jgi:hypothetical protein